MLTKERQNELMRGLIKEVEENIKVGNNPFACFLIGQHGDIVCKGRNLQNSTKDRTAHAEIVLIRKATKQLGRDKLDGYSIISNSEPCSMCISALIKAGINTIYYGAPMDKGNNPFIHAEEIAIKSNFPVIIIGGILEKECMEQIYNLRKENF